MQLFVEKDTDLMRSTFVTLGLAWLMYAILIKDRRASQIVLHDVGSAFALDIPAEADELLAEVRKAGYLPPLLPAIKKPLSAGEQKEIDSGTAPEVIWRKYEPAGFEARGGNVVDYGAQRQIAFAEKPSKKQPREEGGEIPRHPDFPVWAHLCSYFGKGSAMRTVYPGILHTWHAHTGENAIELLKLILGCYGTFPNEREAAQQGWAAQLLPAIQYPDWNIETLVTASSLVSPSTVQGTATLTAASRLNNQPLSVFWLEIYLAFAGYMKIGMPFTLGSDVMLYYPLPRRIGLYRLMDIQAEYRDADHARRLYRFSNQMVRAKLDALAHIAYYQSVVEHYRQNLPDPHAAEYEQIDEHSVTGFAGYYYKDIGGTQIPFDETLFALPVWLPLTTDESHLIAARHLLEAHQKLLESVRGKPPKNALTADELVLFNTYRRFITLGEEMAWIEFAIRYTAYRFVKLLDMGWLPDLHIDVFKETLFNMQTDKMDYQEIFDNPGFVHIAAAIRECTVDLLWRTKRQNNPESSNFKVRYGLGDDLIRNAHESDLFIEALSDFIHDFQRESSNVLASSGEQRRFNIHVDVSDIEELTRLIPKYGSRVIAKLLVAAGYSSAYRKSD